MREAARRILESGDFRFGSDAETGLLEWILRQIEKFFSFFGGLRETAPFLSWVIVGVCMLILGAIFAHAFAVFRRTLRAAKSRSGGREAAARREKASQLLAAAREAAAAGDIPRALTLYLRAAIAGLDQRGVQRLTETATVREYLALLRRHPQERSLFEQFLRFYEPGVFGRRPIGAEPLKECDRIAGRLACEP